MKSTEELKALEINVKMKAKEKLQSTTIRDESDLMKELKGLTISLTNTQASILDKVSGKWLLALYVYEAWSEADVRIDQNISVDHIAQMLQELNLITMR